MQPAPLSRSGARPDKAAAATKVMHLRLYFASPDQSAMQAVAQAIATPSSPDYRHYLTVSQFRALFAPPTATTQAVNAYLASVGVTVGPLDPNGMSEPVSGTVEQLNSALHTTMQQVRSAAGALVVGSTEAPGLPANLAGAVSYIDGLTPWVQAHDNLASAPMHSAVKASAGGAQPAAATPAVTKPDAATPAVTKPATAGTQECSALTSLPSETSVVGMDPGDLASAYKLSGFYSAGDTGQGVTVGLIEYDTYDASAVSAWEQCLGVSPTIDVEQDAISPPPSSPVTLEAASDIDTLMSIAPSATIAVYETANNPGIDLDPWTEAITGAGLSTPLPSLPSVISSSWGLCEPDEGTSASAIYATEENLFSEALMQGQTIFAASGDYGSAACAGNTQLAVNDPASNPLVTAVGGTASDTVTGTQYVWNSAQASTSSCLGNSSNTFINCVPGASGGGLSQVWAQPTYQPADASLQTGCSSAELTEPPVSGTGSSGCREVPDVSALAGDPYWELCTSTGSSGICAFTNSGEYFVALGGTSLAAPSWAGTMAMVDEECGANVGFLNEFLYSDTADGHPDVGAVTATGNNDYTGANKGLYGTYADGSQNLATGLGYLGGVDLSSRVLCTVPGPPTGLTATAGDETIQLSWNEPTNPGRSGITGYTATITPGGTKCTTGSPGTPCVFNGLTNGTPYQVSVTATNTYGTGPAATTGWVTPVPKVQFTGFTPEPGAGTAIGEGADGAVWVLGTPVVPGGHAIYEWNPKLSEWVKQSGGAVTIAVDQNGDPWIINNANKIYHWTGTAWTLEPGLATAISVGADGIPWITGTFNVAGGHPIYQWNTLTSSWTLQPGASVAIAVGLGEAPWVINSYGSIYQWTGTSWTHQPGAATAISEGANGAVWVVGTLPSAGGHPIYEWNGKGWTPQPGGAVAITVGPTGLPWVINSANKIYANK